MCNDAPELLAIAGELNTLHNRIYQALETLPQGLRNERSFLANATTLTLQPQSKNLERITGFMAYVSSTGGRLSLASDMTWPIPIGLTVVHGLDIYLQGEDARTLVQSTAGELSLILFGCEVPDKGNVW